MSLINDALKKAQKQRTGEVPSLGSMPSIGGEAPRQIASRRKSGGGNGAMVGGGIAVAVLVLGAGGAWFALREKPAPSSQPSSSAVGPAKAEALSSQPSAPPVYAPAVAVPNSQPATGNQPTASTPASPQPASASAFTLPIAAPAKQPEPPPAKADVPKQFTINPPPTPAAEPPAPAPAAPARQLEPRAIQYIEALKVGAIMARSANDAKVLMNDRVYRVGSLVEPEMGLRLTGITPSSLTFGDASGGSYTRNF